jgi:predicted negative regulator of RcsB-dependent stress response
MSADKKQQVLSKQQRSADQTTVELPQGEVRESEVPVNVSEDIYRFWHRHGNKLVVYSVVLLAAVLGTQLWTFFSERHEAKLRGEFAGLVSIEEKLAFAQAHPKHGLAGYARIQAGQEAYSKGDHALALDHFRNAEVALSKSSLSGWLQLAQAGCLIALDQRDEAKVLLDRIAGNELLAKGIRAEATFKAMILAKGTGEAVDSAALDALDPNGFWAERFKTIQYY